MTKTIDQLSTLTDAATDDVLLLRDTSTGDDRQISVADSRFTQYGQSESVTLSSNVLTIPYGQSTVKLPSSVWDGTANLVIQQIQFSGGAQPAEGYEFALIVPRSGEALVAGTLGNEVLFQDGALLKTNAYLNQDFPCYPDAADNPNTDPVSLAAPYYRLIFRVDGYSGSDPIISLDKLPDSIRGSNDNGSFERRADGTQFCFLTTAPATFLDSANVNYDWTYPSSFSSVPAIWQQLKEDGDLPPASRGNADYDQRTPTASSTGIRVIDNTSSFTSGDTINLSVYAKGVWH